MPTENKQLKYTASIQFRLQQAHADYIKENMMSRVDRDSLNKAAQRVMETILDSRELREEVVRIWEAVG